MADELDDLFGSEGEEQDEQQQEPVFDDAAPEDDMEDVPVQNEVSGFRLQQ